MATDHTQTVRDLLSNAGISDVYKGVPLSTGDVDNAVFCHAVGGVVPTPMLDGAGGTSLKRPRIQITVRAEPRDTDSARSLARTCYDALDHPSPPSGYVGVWPQGDLRLVTIDEEERAIFTFDVLLMIKE